ncbi:MAG: dihydroorotate dehydrogenase [Candidatus Atribacteria bacterium]|nr:dihydroorotate dehydrogenase [Candidatus Atribacteria bacterium]
MNLQVHLGNLTLSNPVILASGTAGYGREIAPYLDLDRLGALTLKGLSLNPWFGNPPPRIHETYAGIMNSIGLENKGFDRFVREDLPFLENFQTKVIANIWGKTIEEYSDIAQRMNGLERIDAIEVNVSCPNLEQGGKSFSSSSQVLCQLIQDLRQKIQKPLIVKLGPHTDDLENVLLFMEKEGVDILSITNTFPALAVDVENQSFIFSKKTAGLSGPAVKPLALQLVYDIIQRTRLPVIGMGGIMKAEDALEYLLIGARAIALGSVNLINPSAAIQIIGGIEAYLIQKNILDINELIGKVREVW